MEDLERIHRMEVLEKLCEKLSEKNAKRMEDWMENHPIERDFTKSYLHTIKGEKEAAEEVDRKIMAPFLQKRDAAQKKLVAAQEELKNLKAQSDMLICFYPVQPPPVMIKGLKDDLEKLYWNSEKVGEMQGLLVDKEARLDDIEEKNRKLCEENEVMRRMLSGLEKMEGVERNSVEAEPPNAIDIDRMIRDYRAFSRDIEAAREARIAWENKLKDVELTLLAHKLVETTARVEERRELLKRNKILVSGWEKLTDVLEAQMEKLISDTEEHQRRCEEEVRRMMEDIRRESDNLDLAESDAMSKLKDAKLRLEEETERRDRIVQGHTHRLNTLVERLSWHKERAASIAREIESFAGLQTGSIPGPFPNVISAEATGAVHVPGQLTLDGSGGVQVPGLLTPDGTSVEKGMD